MKALIKLEKYYNSLLFTVKETKIDVAESIKKSYLNKNLFR